jgi:hypothetical protein
MTFLDMQALSAKVREYAPRSLNCPFCPAQSYPKSFDLYEVLQHPLVRYECTLKHQFRIELREVELHDAVSPEARAGRDSAYRC